MLFVCSFSSVVYILKAFSTLYIVFLCSPLPGLCKDPIFCFIDAFFYLVYSAIDALYCTFFHLLTTLVPESVWFSMISLPLLNFSFLSCIIFLITLSCLCLPIAPWISLKQIFWVLYQENHTATCILVQLLEDGALLVISWFLDFSCSLEFCVALTSYKVAVTLSSRY